MMRDGVGRFGLGVGGNGRFRTGVFEKAPTKIIYRTFACIAKASAATAMLWGCLSCGLC